MVAQANGIDAGAIAVEDRVADMDAAGDELLAGADRDRVPRGIGGDHVGGLVQRDAVAAALADGEVVVAAMAAESPAGAVDDVALAIDEAAVAAEEAALALAGEEAEVLATRASSRREAVAGGDGADLVLGHLGQREAEAASSSGGSAASM